LSTTHLFWNYCKRLPLVWQDTFLPRTDSLYCMKRYILHHFYFIKCLIF
jgi:hypothetical protein